MISELTSVDSLVDGCRENGIDFIIGNLKYVDHPKKLPRISGVYFVAFGRVIIYVGSSVDLNQRWCGHSLKNLICGDNPHRRIYYKSVDSRFRSKEEEEAFWIMILRPQFNLMVKARLSFKVNESDRI